MMSHDDFDFAQSLSVSVRASISAVLNLLRLEDHLSKLCLSFADHHWNLKWKIAEIILFFCVYILKKE